jgi:hypothetical protein
MNMYFHEHWIFLHEDNTPKEKDNLIHSPGQTENLLVFTPKDRDMTFCENIKEN